MAMPVVLLVEDNAINRKLFRDILEFEFEVLDASSATAAQAVLETRTPDLIIMDVELPGMDGLSLIRELKKDPRYAGIPAVVLSAHAISEHIQVAKEAGCEEYVTKPLLEDPIAFARRMAELAARRA